MASEAPKLIVLNTELRGQEFPVDGPSVTIGRSSEHEIVIDSVSISRSHARIERVGDQYVIQDLGSRNGIKVDGRIMGRAPLEPGMLVTVGDIEMQFVTSADAASTEAPAAEPAPSPTPPPEAVLPAAPGATMPPTAAASAVPSAPEPQGPAALPQRTEQQPPGTQKALGPVMGTFVVLFAVVGVGALVLMQMNRKPIERVLNVDPILIRVGERRWVNVVGYVGDPRDNVRTRGSVIFKEESVRVTDPSVADAKKFDEGELVVKGLAGGSTDVLMRSRRSNRIVLRVMVRGRVADPLADMDLDYMTPRKRTGRAAAHVRAGDRLADSKIYDALLQYRLARRLLKPIKNQSPLYQKAYDKEKAIEGRVKLRYDELVSRVRMARVRNDLDGMMQAMADILDLIPDEGDPRRQRTQYYLANVLRIEEARKR